MLGLGWTEMLVIAALALIVVGPKDLPVMLRQLGRAVGVVRRMGNEFRSEFNKMAALDEIKDVRKSLTDPLRSAQAEIQREFNKTTSTGVKPSGALKPDTTDGESVVNAIKTQAGMSLAQTDDAMSEALAHSRAKVVADAPPPDLAGDIAGGAKPATKGKAATKPASKAKAGSKAASDAKSADGKAPARSKPAPKSTTTRAAAKPVAAKSSRAKAVAAKPEDAPKSTATAKPAPAKAAAKKVSETKSAASKSASKPALKAASASNGDADKPKRAPRQTKTPKSENN